MEDWKKKYEELFGHVQDFHKRFSDQCSIKKEIEECIPELAESEDERIRKEIIDFLTDGIWNSIIIDKVRQTQRYAKWIAYLERQKEQRPAECIEDSVKFEEGFKAGREVGFHEGVESVKPAEWSEEDEKILRSLITDYEYAVSDSQPVWKENFQKKLEWLKSLPERLNLQPRQEWSEEDKTNFAWFDRFFRAESVIANGRDIPQDKYLWFKSLRPQPHWNPTTEQLSVLSDILEESKGNRLAVLKDLYKHIKEA